MYTVCFGVSSCAIYTHTPAQTSSTSFQLYYFVIQFCSTNWLGHGHGYKWHSSYPPSKQNNKSKHKLIKQ